MAGEPRVLILGGTGEARRLAERLGADGVVRPVSSLAGVTVSPILPPGEVRRGGFGGVEGLRDWLAREGIAAVIDASHPFAARISAHAVAAAGATGVPLLRLERPAWRPEPGDRWHLAADWPHALALAACLGRRVLATVGARDARHLLATEGLDLVVRSIERPDALPQGAVWLQARPPFTLAQELATLRERWIQVLLAKNSGGEAGRSKLLAARELGLPVVMLARPALPAAETVASQDELAARLYALLGGRST